MLFVTRRLEDFAEMTFLMKLLELRMKSVRLCILSLAVLLACLTSADGHAGQPLKVFILSGQSNMQGHAHVRTIDAMRLDPETAEILSLMREDDGSDVVCDDVWISSIGSSEDVKSGRLTVGFGAEPRGPKIGPEFTFGIFMQKQLDEPILIIKTAWGGKSLHTDFRSPSAGPYRFNPSQLEAMIKQGKDLVKIKTERAEATGRYYRLMMEHVQSVLGDIKQVYPDYDADAGYELAGFVWFQGWNDMVDRGVYPKRDQPGGYDQYSEVLKDFIRDVRKDLKAPELPFVIGVMGAGGPTDQYSAGQMRYKPIHDNFRNAMAAPAEMSEFEGNVAAVRTEDFWDMRLMKLRARDSVIREKVKTAKEQQKLSRDEERSMLEKLRSSEFNADEIELLDTSVSNAEFHYLGSARIIAPIGKAFAEAMSDLME
ncbi:MAG: sialate O-acetylesterase [Planctomycetota bacterium]